MIESKAEFARRVGLSKPRISQLVARGLPVTDDGKIDVDIALAWMNRTLDPAKRLEQKPRQSASPAPADIPEDGDLTEAKTRHEWIKVQRAQLALEADRGAMVPRDTVERAIFARAKAERDALMTWVMRVSPTIAAEIGTDPGPLHRALDREIRDHLRSLSEAPVLETDHA